MLWKIHNFLHCIAVVLLIVISFSFSFLILSRLMSYEVVWILFHDGGNGMKDFYTRDMCDSFLCEIPLVSMTKIIFFFFLIVTLENSWLQAVIINLNKWDSKKKNFFTASVAKAITIYIWKYLYIDGRKYLIDFFSIDFMQTLKKGVLQCTDEFDFDGNFLEIFVFLATKLLVISTCALLEMFRDILVTKVEKR